MAEATPSIITPTARRRAYRPNPSDPPFWTATEAITFLALREPVKLPKLNADRQALWDQWEVSSSSHGTEQRWLELLEAHAAPAPSCPVDLADLKPFGRGPGIALSIQSRVSKALGRSVGFPELAEMFRKEWAEHWRQTDLIRDATAALVQAVAHEEIEMLGIPDDDPSGSPIPIPPHTFMRVLTIRNDRLEPADNVAGDEWEKAYGGHQRTYHDLGFRPADVRKLAESLARSQAVDGELTTRTKRKAGKWVGPEKLDREAQAYCADVCTRLGRPPCVNDIIRALQDKTGCRRDCARAACARLPANLRRPAQRPRKTPP